MKANKPLLILLTALTIITLLYGVMVYGTPITTKGATLETSNTNSVQTPYGESLEITLGGSSETSGQASYFQLTNPNTASWLASYQDTSSQDVYEVNGTYKSQEQVTMEYSLSITYSNVETISATVKIKAIDANTPSNYHEYTLANSKSLTGASPIADTGSTIPSILQHLTDIGGSTTNENVAYEIYCQVTAQGTKSGDTLTATIPYTHFGGFNFVKSSESSTAQVTPTISAATTTTTNPWKLSYYDDIQGLPEGTTMKIIGLTISITIITAIILDWRQRQ